MAFPVFHYHESRVPPLVNQTTEESRLFSVGFASRTLVACYDEPWYAARKSPESLYLTTNEVWKLCLTRIHPFASAMS